MTERNDIDSLRAAIEYGRELEREFGQDRSVMRVLMIFYILGVATGAGIVLMVTL